MSDFDERPGLRAIDHALAQGDLEGVKRALFELDDAERRILEAQMGRDALARTFRSARSRRRGPGLGRVVVLPGLMGTELDSVDEKGDPDKIWVNLFRIAQGRLDELKLTLDGRPLPPAHVVRTAGLYKKVYLPLLLALDEHWDVRPFGYDWRMDVDLSARALADDVRAWAAGEPAHLVVHSMGGFVARRFIQLFPDVWASMNDPERRGRGGRLVMLGTPNRGSFAIPGALSGEEDVVKKLALIDLTRGVDGVLDILNTFPGSYQTMPSPRIDLGDDHVKLFDAGTWGTLPVFPRLLEAGRRFQETLHPVTTPERLLYVAGYDQKTPHRIKVVAPGKFEYQETLDGDGRVPHELGLLPDVPTLFVLEKHGDLAKNEKVLGAIHDLLVNGSSSLLLSQLPADRAARAAKAPFRPFPSRPVPPELLALAAQVRSARRAKRVTLDAEIAAARLEALVLSEVLGEAPDLHVARTRMATRAALAKRPRLRVEVVWGDLTRVNADVFAVGHYHGVPPTNALGALDRAVSRGTGRSLLDDHVRRGLISGDLGTVTFFPWDRRTLAIAGMGHSGTFGEGELRVLARSLTFAVANVPAARTVATVLIGSGDGGLSVESCIRGMFGGMADALEAGPMAGQVQALRVVEWRRDRASRIHDALKQVQADLASRLEIVLDRSFKAGPGGGIGKEEAVSLLVSAAAAAARQGKTTAGHRRLASLLRGQERALPVLPRLTETLREIPAGTEVALVAAGAPPNAQRIPTRLTFAGDPAPIRVAAITNTATVAERPISIDRTLVDGLVRRMTDPDVAAGADLSDLLRRLLVPHDFLALLRSDESFVFEVDRFMARVHWEMLTGTEDASAEPLSVRTPFARQLRTMYSAPPAPAPPRTEKLTALVIGDPGDPARQHSLPGARREALKVADLLRGHDVEVVALIGAPDATGQGPVAGIRAADRLECLRLLMRGGFDLLHYAGHGDFDPEAPDRVGWLFKDGLLTARELERVSAPPRLIVANACLSARASEKADGAALTPGLADEFFRRGVRNYVGTAWEVNDAGAVLFAETLYGALLRKETRPTLGEAVLEARRALWRERHVYGSLWAAYQHYGDPEALVRGAAPAAVDGRPRASKRARPRKRGR